MTDEPAAGWTLIRVQGQVPATEWMARLARSEKPISVQDLFRCGRTTWQTVPAGLALHRSDHGLKSPRYRHRHEAVKWSHDRMAELFGWDRKTRTFPTFSG